MDLSDQLNIKGMVCNRCVQTIKEALSQHGFSSKSIFLGKVVFTKSLLPAEIEIIRKTLNQLGFDLIEDRNQKFLLEIKQEVQEFLTQILSGEKHQNLSDHLSQKFSKNYDSISEFFRRLEGTTLEKYFINIRVEKVKEFLVYTDLSLSEIAFKLGFSSPFHLSQQFKNKIGQNPSEFKKMRKEDLTGNFFLKP